MRGEYLETESGIVSVAKLFILHLSSQQNITVIVEKAIKKKKIGFIKEFYLLVKSL